MSQGSIPDGSRYAQLGVADGLPKRFGKYTLLHKLATGGMAELFLALHRSVAGFEKLVVIKRILPSMNQDQAFIDMLLHEARIAATLSHPNVVQIFDVGFHEGTYYIAMEHIHGEDLRGIVRQMKRRGMTDFPLEHALGIISGVCAGLDYAHDRRALDNTPLNIVHRDISPQNILVTFEGDVKVVDFGIAKSGTSVGEDTKSGRLKGKVPYMSPEQARGEEIDWRSDIFSTGIVLFELTTGKRLFKGANELETLRLICDRDYPYPSQVRPGYPARLESIVMRALAKDRQQRYQRARDMQADLEAYIRDERIAVSNLEMSRWMQTLFADRLSQQNAALQDIKQLADVIAAQTSRELGAFDSIDLTSHSGLSTAPSVPGSSHTLPQPTSSRARPFLIALAVGLGMSLVGAGSYLAVRMTREPNPPAAASASSTAPAQPVLGSVRIVTRPDDASIWINGALRAEKTPATIEKLPLDAQLSIEITKQGFAPVRRTITLTNSRPDELIDADMPRGGVTLEVVTTTPGARLFVDNKAMQGLRVEGLAPNEEHRVVLAANGYVAKTAVFTASANETRTLTLELDKDAEGGKGEPPPEAKTAKTAEPPPSATPPPDPPKTGSGKLNVASRGGFCNVSVDGKSYGPTPVGGIVLPAGNHSVTCKPDSGAIKTSGVRIEPDQTARISFDLTK